MRRPEFTPARDQSHRADHAKHDLNKLIGASRLSSGFLAVDTFGCSQLLALAEAGTVHRDAVRESGPYLYQPG